MTAAASVAIRVRDVVGVARLELGTGRAGLAIGFKVRAGRGMTWTVGVRRLGHAARRGGAAATVRGPSALIPASPVEFVVPSGLVVDGAACTVVRAVRVVVPAALVEAGPARLPVGYRVPSVVVAAPVVVVMACVVVGVLSAIARWRPIVAAAVGLGVARPRGFGRGATGRRASGRHQIRLPWRNWARWNWARRSRARRTLMGERGLGIGQVRNSPADVISVLKAIFGEVFYVASTPAVFCGTGRSPGLLHAVDEAGEFEGAVARIKLVEIVQLAPPLLLP